MKKPAFGQYGAMDGAREEEDYYRSPPEAVLLLLASTELTMNGPILDAGAGDGILLNGLKERGYQIRGIELSMKRDEHPDIERGVNFLTFTPEIEHRSIIMNPPYKKSDEFIRHALGLLPTTGRVYALLRHTWPCAKKRADLLPMIREVLICGRLKMPPASKQDSDKGHSGMVDFSWFVFERGWSSGTRIVRA